MMRGLMVIWRYGDMAIVRVVFDICFVHVYYGTAFCYRTLAGWVKVLVRNGIDRRARNAFPTYLVLLVFVTVRYGMVWYDTVWYFWIGVKFNSKLI